METGQLECIKIRRRAAVIIIVVQKVKGTIVNIIQGRQEVRINVTRISEIRLEHRIRWQIIKFNEIDLTRKTRWRVPGRLGGRQWRDSR
jgi:hypothetical protein